MKFAEGIGQINLYSCKECKTSTPTILLASGVTPMFIRCRNKTECSNPHASSACYRIGPRLYRDRIEKLTVEWAWYRPNAKIYRQLEQSLQRHVHDGGLLLETLEVAMERNAAISFEGIDTPKAFLQVLRTFYEQSP